MRKKLNLFLPLYLPALLYNFSSSLLTPVLPIYAQDFGISYGLVGLVLAGDSIGMLLGDLPSGMLMRRLGQKQSMILGLLMTGVSTTAIYWAPSITSIIALRLLAGMGVSLFAVSRHYFLTEMAPPDIRGRIISIYGGFVRAGRMMGPVVGGALATAFGLRLSFLAFGVTCLLALGIIVFFLPHVEVKPHPVSAGTKLPALKVFWDMLKRQKRAFGTAGTGFLLMQFIRSGPAIIIPLYAANVIGLDVGVIGTVMSISSGLDMLLFYPTGILMDRRGRKVAIISSCLIQAIGMAVVPLSFNFGSLMVAGLLWGLGNGLGAGVMLTLGSDLAPQQGRSEFLGAWMLVGDLGGTSGPLVIGKAAEALPLPATAWIAASAGILAALIFALFVPETLKWRHIQDV